MSRRQRSLSFFSFALEMPLSVCPATHSQCYFPERAPNFPLPVTRAKDFRGEVGATVAGESQVSQRRNSFSFFSFAFEMPLSVCPETHSQYYFPERTPSFPLLVTCVKDFRGEVEAMVAGVSQEQVSRRRNSFSFSSFALEMPLSVCHAKHSPNSKVNGPSRAR